MKLDEAIAKLADDDTLSREERWSLLMEILKLVGAKLAVLEATKPKPKGRGTR